MKWAVRSLWGHFVLHCSSKQAEWVKYLRKHLNKPAAFSGLTWTESLFSSEISGGDNLSFRQ